MQGILQKYLPFNNVSGLFGEACKSFLFGRLKNFYVVSAVAGWLLYAILNFLSSSFLGNGTTSSFLWHGLYDVSIILCFFTCICIPGPSMHLNRSEIKPL